MYSLLLGGAALLLVVAFIASIKKEVKPLYIIYVGGAITLVGGIATLYGTFRQNKSSSANTQKIILTTEQALKIVQSIDTLSKINNELSNNINSVVNNNKQLTEKNLELTNKATDILDSVKIETVALTTISQNITNEVTGGNSFPAVEASVINMGNRSFITFEAKRIGDYPLSNVRIEHPSSRYSGKPVILKEIPFLGYWAIQDLFQIELDSSTIATAGGECQLV